MTPTPRWMLLWLCLCVALAGCAPAEAPTPTPVPTVTPDPATSFVPTAPAPGSADNPLRVQVVALDADAANAADAAATLTEGLRATDGLQADVVLAPTQADALRALCDLRDGPDAAWLTGPHAAVALARGCGTPLLIAVRGGVTSDAVAIVVRRNSQVTSLGGLAGRAFCRVAVADSTSWLVPALMLRAANVDITQPGTVTEHATPADMVDAVLAGDCEAAAVAASALNVAPLADQSGQWRVVATSPALPFAVLFAPQGTLLGTQQALSQAFTRAGGNANRRAARAVLVGDDVQPVDAEAFAPLLALLESAGVNAWAQPDA